VPLTHPPNGHHGRTSEAFGGPIHEAGGRNGRPRAPQPTRAARSGLFTQPWPKAELPLLDGPTWRAAAGGGAANPLFEVYFEAVRKMADLRMVDTGWPTAPTACRKAPARSGDVLLPRSAPRCMLRPGLPAHGRRTAAIAIDAAPVFGELGVVA
jgi:hypothetical protein